MTLEISVHLHCFPCMLILHYHQTFTELHPFMVATVQSVLIGCKTLTDWLIIPLLLTIPIWFGQCSDWGNRCLVINSSRVQICLFLCVGLKKESEMSFELCNILKVHLCPFPSPLHSPEKKSLHMLTFPSHETWFSKLPILDFLNLCDKHLLPCQLSPPPVPSLSVFVYLLSLSFSSRFLFWVSASSTPFISFPPSLFFALSLSL